MVLAAAPILIFLAGRYLVFRSVNPKHVLELAAAAGAAGFVAVGFCGSFEGMAFIENVMPLGRTGALFSMGHVALLNLVVALVVSAGVALVIYEFLEQTLWVRGD